MQKAVLMFFMVFLVFGMLLHAPLVFADNDNNSGSSGNSNNFSSLNDSEDDDNSNANVDDENDVNETGDDGENRSGRENRLREREFITEDGKRVKIEREVEFKDGKRKIRIERRITDADGNVRKVKIEIEEKDGKRKIKSEGEDEFADTELELESEFDGNESDLKAVTSDGRKHKIKVLPDRAIEIIMERLNTLNISNITLEEIREGNIPRVVYIIQTNKNGRFLGIFKLKLKIEGQIDPETGEVIDINGPWWAFFVVGGKEDSPDETLIKGKTKIKAETFNGTSEIKIKMKFGTESIDQETIVQEILNRLNNISVANLLKVEESDEPLEEDEELEVEAKIKEKITKVEFELKFMVSSDDRGEIVNATVTRLSKLTKEEINNVLVLKTKDENDDGEEDERNEKTTLCHIPPGNPEARKTIKVGTPPAVAAHLAHGDTLGACAGTTPPPGNETNDTQAPQWFNNSTNSTLNGTLIEHRVRWTDNVSLSGYIFSFDNGNGSFLNDSFVAMSGAENWSNVSKVINATINATINWRVYANDTFNNWNVTNAFSYNTTS